MYRYALEKLIEWKDTFDRKPLIIEGPRQVGKTYLMKEFGKDYFKQIIYINFEKDSKFNSLFNLDLDPKRIIFEIEHHFNMKIDTKDTLILFDEIQACPRALTSLKYFNESAREYHIIASSSYPNDLFNKGHSYPVGCVENLKLYPLSFKEFLLATSNDNLVKLLDSNDSKMINVFKDKYIELLKIYYYVGGMPEVVSSYITNNDLNKVREIQNRILSNYEYDFSKHAPNEIVPRIRQVFNSIPSQLGKENKKFIYGLVKDGSRAKDYELAIMWLMDTGLIHKVSRCSAPKLPLKAYEDLKAFKLFLLDVGLLGAMANLSSKTLLQGNELFVEFKGSLTEQYVLQELNNHSRIKTYYYTNEKNTLEIDFMIDDGSKIIPLEVKCDNNLKAKSLKSFNEKFAPIISLRCSLSDYKKEECLLNLPLYQLSNLEKEI